MGRVFVVELPDLDEAIRLAAMVPTSEHRTLEIRPLSRIERQLHSCLRGRVDLGHSLVEAVPVLDEYRHHHSARADLLRRLGRGSEAHATHGRALELTQEGPERRFRERRLRETRPVASE